MIKMDNTAVMNKQGSSILHLFSDAKKNENRGFDYKDLLSLFDLLDIDNHSINKMPQTTVKKTITSCNFIRT